MFSSISWQSYISTLAILLVIYYSFVLYVYYRKDIILLFTTVRINDKDSQHNNQTKSSLVQDQSASDNYIDEVKALIHQAGYSRLSKDEIIVSLQQLISSPRFDSQTPAFKERLGKIITYECQTNCSMHLDEDDLERVWVGK